MARYQPTHKEETRRRLLESAVNAFRRDGLDATGLKEIMNDLGLTVGGFYRHFESKSELVRACVEFRNSPIPRAHAGRFRTGWAGVARAIRRSVPE